MKTLNDQKYRGVDAQVRRAKFESVAAKKNDRNERSSWKFEATLKRGIGLTIPNLKLFSAVTWKEGLLHPSSASGQPSCSSGLGLSAGQTKTEGIQVLALLSL